MPGPKLFENSESDRLSPLVLATTRRIEAMIKTEAFKAGESLPSERQLAMSFSVSRSIVRAAIKNLTETGLVESKANCRPVVRPPKLSNVTHRRHVAIWLWPNTSDFAAASVLKGIQETDLGSDVRLVIASAPVGDWESTFESERNFLESLADDPVDAGAIVWYLGADRNRPVLNRLREAGVPMIFIDRQPPAGFSADYVGTNNESAARIAVQHLIELGHRRIGLITNMDPASSVSERETGYQRALRTYGIGVDAALVQRDSVDEPIGVETVLDNFLSLPDPPTAIFCINDHLALQLHEVLTRRGIKVPGQLSIVGFDGLLRWVPGGGYLTTVEQDFYRMGQLAAELVIERMTIGQPEAYKHLLLDAPLADHGSTASPNSLQSRSSLK
jgi:LacI family transcriptional regulator